MSAPKKRRLSDLFQKGQLLQFDDGDGDVVEVYLKKLSPIELETVLRNANSARARYVTALRDPSSKEYNEVYAASVDSLTDQTLCIEFLVDNDLVGRMMSIESELADEPEWKDKGYLQGLYDAWNDGLSEKDPEEDEEARRVKAELDRFQGLVEEAMETAREIQRKKYEMMPEEDLQKLALEKLLKARADSAWLNELRLSEVYVATRDPENHKRMYFDTREDLAELPGEVLRKLLDTYREMTVEVVEGKD